MFGPGVLNEIWITDLSLALIGMLMTSSRLFFLKKVHSNSGVRLFLESYCVIVIKHVGFLTIWAILTEAFTCTSLPLNLYTSVFGFEQKFWRIDGFGEKRHRSADLPTPIFICKRNIDRIVFKSDFLRVPRIGRHSRKLIFLLFSQNIAMGELVQRKLVLSSNDLFCGQNLRKFEICMQWRFSRLEMFKISRFFTKTAGA